MNLVIAKIWGATETINYTMTLTWGQDQGSMETVIREIQKSLEEEIFGGQIFVGQWENYYFRLRKVMVWQNFATLADNNRGKRY